LGQATKTRYRPPTFDWGRQQKHVIGPLHLIGAGNKKPLPAPYNWSEWWATKTRYRPPTIGSNGGQQKHVIGPLQLERMVGNKNTLPTLHLVGNKKPLPAPYKADWDNLFFG